MSTVSVVSEQEIAAPADVVYGILADYLHHHPHILPPEISDLVVEEGGMGAGTVVRFKTTVAGSTRSFHQRVEEPEPGRVLREVDVDGDTATTFTVTPHGAGSHVRIETAMAVSGVQGLITRIVAPRLLGKVYADELTRLDAYARSQVDQEQAALPVSENVSPSTGMNSQTYRSA